RVQSPREVPDGDDVRLGGPRGRAADPARPRPRRPAEAEGAARPELPARAGQRRIRHRACRLAGTGTRHALMRIALITQVPPVVEAYTEALRALGHDVVGVLTVTREGSPFNSGEHVASAEAAGLDVVVPSTRARIAPLLRALDVDLAFCSGFPWVIPAEALEAPRHGIVNWHPSALPRYRGPFPVSWAIRNGDTEVGITFHRMDAT